MPQSEPGFRSGFFFQVGLVVPLQSEHYGIYIIYRLVATFFQGFFLVSIAVCSYIAEYLEYISYWIRGTLCRVYTRIGSSNQLLC